MALAGLVVVVVVGVSAAFAPWIAPFDPEVQERWWGRALAPGASHLDLRNEMSLVQGRRPERLDVPQGAFRAVGDGREHVLEIDVQGVTESLLLVTLEGAAIQLIRQGATKLPSVDLAPTDALWLDGATAPLPARSLRVGEPAPAGVPATGERSVARLRLVRHAPQDRFRVAARFAGDGVCTEVMRDGKPAPGELRIDAADVVDVRLDGDSLTHVHLLGTDQEGRDTLSRVIWGGRISIFIGLVATCVSLVIGVLYGATAGFAGGRVDVLMMRAVDILYALPYIFLVILLVMVFNRNILVLFAALGLVTWLTPSRIVRGQVLSLKHREFVDAARTLGASRWTILRRHLIPNTLGVVVVFTTLTIPEVILQESFLSFIGLSVQYDGRPLESWGSLVDYGRQVALGSEGDNWWLLVFPAAAMSVTLLSLNFLGDGLRDALDPQQRGRR
jgi:oligopeptide transport system permease protein